MPAGDVADNAILSSNNSLPYLAPRTPLNAFTALQDNASGNVAADHGTAFRRAVLPAAASARLLRTFNEIAAQLGLLIAQLRPAYRGTHELAGEHAGGLLHVLRAGKTRPGLEACQEHLHSGEQFSPHPSRSVADETHRLRSIEL